MNEFSVCQFFLDESYEYSHRFVSMEEAVRAFWDKARSPAAMLGTTKRIILTDGGDCINLEWKHGEGVTFPPELKGRK